MFDVGFTEIILIGIVALVVIGPERLPAVAKTAGQWIGKRQGFVRGVKTDLASELQSGDLKKLIGDQREQINELKNMVSSAKRDFENNSRDVVQGAKKSLSEMEASVKEIDGVAGEKDRVASTQAAATIGAESDTVSLSKPSENNALAESTPVESDKIDAVETVSGSTLPPLVKPEPSSTNGSHDNPPMRTDSNASIDDSTDLNRTGTESGS